MQQAATREHAHYSGRRSVPLTVDALANYTAVLICTDHDAVDYRLLDGYSGLIIDTRNVMLGRRIRGTVIAA